MNHHFCRVGLGLVLLVGLFAAGCAGRGDAAEPGVMIDHTSQRLLLVSLDEAVAKRDYAAMVQAMDGAFRGPYRSVVMAGRDYVSALESLAGTAEEKLDPQMAQRFRQQAQRVYSGLFPSPLEGAVKEQGVDWDIVRVLDEGECLAVTVGGQSTPFDKQYVICEVKGHWFVAPHQKEVPPRQRVSSYKHDAGYTQKNLRRYIDLTNDLKKKIKSGQINRANFEQKMSALKAAAAAEETRRQD